MLPGAHRLRDGDDFRHTIRRGAKGASPTLVTHVASGTGAGGPTTVGFVVSKQVGGAVVRNRVKRQLRHLMRDRLEVPAPGSRVVVRALPAAAEASSVHGSGLAGDLDTALTLASRRAKR